MESYSTEEQQVEAIKQFWKENGTSIILGAVIGLGGLWGWRYYNDQRIEAQETASIQYEQTVESLSQNEQGFTSALTYLEQNKDNNYAMLLAFQLAQEAVSRDDLNEAAKQLSFVVNSTDVPAIAALANIRLARVHIQQAAYEQAMSALDAVGQESFNAQVQELRGDIHASQGNLDKARAAYSAALEDNAGNNLLKMKLDNLIAKASA
ncbi:YfgM family protein [Bowmanella dokdonensis]|uniref:Ancillary SecYEG translocon subunit n=1 Tax=Bowmanella dokdonensis TaxID=751969 RepID=A0A939DPL9_9ALTE|nr:tetratricopeptide repeat protein [Bowmanella dokdonensis]MBN7826419.1 tetratricopeptide repeat protein [Bowmanella dokdonensis]